MIPLPSMLHSLRHQFTENLFAMTNRLMYGSRLVGRGSNRAREVTYLQALVGPRVSPAKAERSETCCTLHSEPVKFNLDLLKSEVTSILSSSFVPLARGANR